MKTTTIIVVLCALTMISCDSPSGRRYREVQKERAAKEAKPNVKPVKEQVKCDTVVYTTDVCVGKMVVKADRCDVSKYPTVIVHDNVVFIHVYDDNAGSLYYLKWNDEGIIVKQTVVNGDPRLLMN